MRLMNLIKKCLYSLKIIIFLGSISSVINAAENDLASAYLCIDSEVILPSKNLEEKVNLSRQLMANTTLLITDGKLLFFRQLFSFSQCFFVS